LNKFKIKLHDLKQICFTYSIELLDFGLSVVVVGGFLDVGDHFRDGVVVGVQVGHPDLERVELGVGGNVLHDLLDESHPLGGAGGAAPSVGRGVRPDLLTLHLELGALVAVVEVLDCCLQGRVVQVAPRVLEELGLQVLDLALFIHANLIFRKKIMPNYIRNTKNRCF